MRIAVNISGLREDWFLEELLQRFAGSSSEHSILLVSDRAIKELNIIGSNVTIEVLSPTIKSNVSLKYWYDIKLTTTAKKFKADVLVHLGSFCSLATKLPQVLVVGNLDFIHYPKKHSASRRLFYNLYQKKFFAKAKRIVALNEWIKQELDSKLNVATEKIFIVQPVANALFAPVNFEQRESTKDGHADGREFFLFANEENNPDSMMNLLKAFSLFKKWQQSSMKLLVTGKVDAGTMEKLKTYRHREDVELLGNITREQFARLLAASYAFLDIAKHKGVSKNMAAAFTTGIPVIAGNGTEMHEVPAGTVLNAEPTNVEEIANQLKLVYRDERLRGQLIEKGLLQADKFSWDNSLANFWQAINTAASK